MFCPYLKDFVQKRSPLLDTRLDPKVNPKVHHPGGNTSDGSDTEEDPREATFEFSEEVSQLLDPSDGNVRNAAPISENDSHLNTSTTSHEAAMDISGIANQLNTSLHIGNQSGVQTSVNDVTDTDQTMQLAVTSTPLRPSSVANPIIPPATLITNFNLSKLSDFGSIDFNPPTNSNDDTDSPIKKRQKTSSFRTSVSIPIGDPGRCAEPRRSSRMSSSTSSFQLQLSSDSSQFESSGLSTMSKPQKPSTAQQSQRPAPPTNTASSTFNASSLQLHLSSDSSQLESSGLSTVSQPPQPSNQLVRTFQRPSTSTTAASSSSSKPSPALTRSRSRAVNNPEKNPDWEILENIGRNAYFSGQEKQLVFDINFDLKKMWNEKNLCWMNTSLTGLLFTLKEVDVELEEAPPEIPRTLWTFNDYLAELAHMPFNTTYDSRLMIKQILREFSGAQVGFGAGNDFVNQTLLDKQQDIETLFQIFSPNTQYDCPWDCLRPEIEWSLTTSACPNTKCIRKEEDQSSVTRTDAVIALSTVPDGKEGFYEKVREEFDSQDVESICETHKCECGQDCAKILECPRLYVCKEKIIRTKKARIVEAKNGIIFSLPRGSNYKTMVIKRFF